MAQQNSSPVEPLPPRTVVNQCQITPQIWGSTSVPSVQKSNNLRRISPSSEFAQGQALILMGTLTDQNCVPITGAMVEIWQANAQGGIDYVDNFGNSTNNSSHKKDPNFAGSGTSITDNLGKYRFITVMPAPINKFRAPHINIRVKHANFLPFESVIYFEDNFLTSKDTVLQKDVTKNSRHLLIAKPLNQGQGKISNIHLFNIALEGSNNYTHY